MDGWRKEGSKGEEAPKWDEKYRVSELVWDGKEQQGWLELWRWERVEEKGRSWDDKINTWGKRGKEGEREGRGKGRNKDAELKWALIKGKRREENGREWKVKKRTELIREEKVDDK